MMLRLLCLLAGLAATVTGLCPEPFKEVGEGCYYFSIEDDHLQMTWAEARQYCQTLGSEVDLAMLDYVCDDFRNLCNYLLLEGTFLNFEATWVGATGSDRIWFWVDGRSLNLSSPYWYVFQPKIDSGCVHLNELKNSFFTRVHLVAEDCAAIRPFICQYNMAN